MVPQLREFLTEWAEARMRLTSYNALYNFTTKGSALNSIRAEGKKLIHYNILFKIESKGQKCDSDVVHLPEGQFPFPPKLKSVRLWINM